MKKIKILIVLTTLSLISFGQTAVTDTDGDTKVETEKTANEDKIRFSLGGTEYLILEPNGRLNFLNTGNSIFLGSGAGTNDDLSNNYNLFMGYRAGFMNTTGRYNVAMGGDVLYNNTTGSYNIASGYRALYTNTAGNYNVANGMYALYQNTTGNYNISSGYGALYSNTTGSYNIVSGYTALYKNKTGMYNVVLGAETGRYNDGSNNTFLGAKAGRGTALHNSTGNVFIGYSAGYNETGSDKLYIDNSTTATPLIWGDFAANTVNFNGSVGIGTSTPDNKLDVKGVIRAEEVKVETGWADFVFDKNYPLPTLEEIENHIQTEGHLPDIPTAKEVAENGIALGEMNAKLLQKIEELTLYVIEQNKRIEILEKEQKKNNE